MTIITLKIYIIDVIKVIMHLLIVVKKFRELLNAELFSHLALPFWCRQVALNRLKAEI